MDGVREFLIYLMQSDEAEWIEAHGFNVKDGVLMLTIRDEDDEKVVIAAFAPGCWSHIIDVTALDAPELEGDDEEPDEESDNGQAPSEADAS